MLNLNNMKGEIDAITINAYSNCSLCMINYLIKIWICYDYPKNVELYT